jgi:hypothetical protein
MQMLLNRGAIRGRRIISEESFKLFSTHHIDAPQFGPKAGYGYGIAVDTLDGHVRLRHTGGMVSFMSAMHLDLDARLGAFASINAQLGYRPNPVVELALRLMRSEKEHAKPPAIPAFDAAAKVESVESYSGAYISGEGRRLEVKSDSDRLKLIVDGRAIALQQSDDGTFIADLPGFDRFPIVFERAPDAPAADSADKSKTPFIALACGPDWFAREGYQGQTPLKASPELAKYAGMYYSENPWNGVIPVVQRQGQLWLDGTEPLIPIGNHLFRVGAQPSSPSVAEFSEWTAQRPNFLWVDGVQFRRIGDANA